jgi:hypothetical protein
LSEPYAQHPKWPGNLGVALRCDIYTSIPEEMGGDMHLKVGSKVRVVGIPDGLEDYPNFPSKSTFLKCVGHEFIVAGFNEVGMAELHIKSVTGKDGEKIWIEPRFLELLQL